MGRTGTIAAALLFAAGAQRGATPPDGNWPSYRHDLRGTGYSPLTQIDAANVGRLTQAWSYRMQAATPVPSAGGRGAAAGLNSEATPIVVAGVMYLPAAGRVVALDPDTGAEVWQHAIAGAAPSRRGVAFWPGDADHAARIFVTAGRRLIALDAKTGDAVTAFGVAGEVDMTTPYNSVPLVYRNIVIVGANTPPGVIGGIGDPRAYDARTGAKRWQFSAVAQPGTPGNETWGGDSWRDRLGVNAWPFYFTLDEQRGLLYVPLASPIPGDYGGDRKGANLFGNAVVALDVETGRYRWHFQTIHHDIWDHDPPAPPGLFDIVRNGRTEPALALTTKSGYMFILNRETGRPIYGVEERPVEASDVPGEQTFATQPIPVKPPPLGRVRYAAADLVTAEDTTPEHAKACADLIARIGGVHNAGPYTPWRFHADGSTTQPTLNFPGTLGGANWGGTAFDASTKYIFVVSQDVGAIGWIEKARDGSRSGSPYDKAVPGGGRGTFDVRVESVGGASLPCQKAPWGRLTAVDSSTGDFAWQVPLGITEQLPAGRQHTGRPALAGPIVTASGLVFVASTDDNRFRAFEAKTGKELWVTHLERRGNANPLTYRGKNGKQYVGVVATDTLVVFSLP